MTTPLNCPLCGVPPVFLARVTPERHGKVSVFHRCRESYYIELSDDFANKEAGAVAWNETLLALWKIPELMKEISEAHQALADIPIGNEHETYSLTKRCEIAIVAKQFAWRQMDEARKDRERLLLENESLRRELKDARANLPAFEPET